MNFLQGIQNFLEIINENWTTIIVIIGLAIGTVNRIKKYINLTDDEKIEIAKTQISETILKLISDAESDYSEWKKAGSIKRSQVIEDIFKIISQLTKKIFDIHIDIDYDYIKILEKIASGKKSFSVASSDLINSWNYKKNGNISPESIRLGSKKKVWWICSKGHEWQATVNSRYSQKCGCPICAGQKILSGENDLQTLYPSIAKEWDNEKNTKKANQVRPMDNKNYWWICSKCGKSYQSSPAHRVGRNSGCPDCARHKTAVAHYKKVKNIDTGEIYESIKSASEKCKINAKSISNCCRGVSKTAGGYHWKFANEIL